MLQLNGRQWSLQVPATTCSQLGSVERGTLCMLPSQPLGIWIKSRCCGGSWVPLAVSLAGPAMRALWPPPERSASPGAAPPLTEARSFSLRSFLSMHHLSLSKGRTCLQVTPCIGSGERTGVVEGWHYPEKRSDLGTAPPVPFLAAAAQTTALCSCPT